MIRKILEIKIEEFPYGGFGYNIIGLNDTFMSLEELYEWIAKNIEKSKRLMGKKNV